MSVSLEIRLWNRDLHASDVLGVLLGKTPVRERGKMDWAGGEAELPCSCNAQWTPWGSLGLVWTLRVVLT